MLLFTKETAVSTVRFLFVQEEPKSKSKICANVFCGAGRECAVTEKGDPTCLCIEKCKPHKRPVCGSNGKTYLNHCELHRDACLTGSKIQVDYDGHCKEKKTDNSAASPASHYFKQVAVTVPSCGHSSGGAGVQQRKPVGYLLWQTTKEAKQVGRLDSVRGIPGSKPLLPPQI
uniref:Uncharacterized protein n=1 Tax=Sphaerodactylus townsendi TaxID=933632 RepID=A0ACB8ET22_9SAUR